MNTAITAALAAVEAPKISRNSRVHAVWYASAQAPEKRRSGATTATGTARPTAAGDGGAASACAGRSPGAVAVSIGLGEVDLSRRSLAAAHAGARHRRALDGHHAHGGLRLFLDLRFAVRG